MKSKSTSIGLVLNKGKINVDGTCNINIILRATIDGVQIRKSIFTGYNISPDKWDNENNKIKSDTNGADIATNEINQMLLNLNKIKTDLEYKGKVASPNSILEIFKNDNYENESIDFIAFSEKEIDSTRKDYSIKHYQGMIGNVESIKKFTNGKLLFSEITPAFLDKYRYWMEHENGNKKNTIYQRLSQIRKFINVAIKNNLTTNYPFKTYKIKAESVDKEYLDLKEVEKLHDIYYSDEISDRIKGTLHYFLLSCYTGLRLSDIKRVTKDTIRNNTIILKTQKTGSKVTIPLNQAALNLINFDLDGIKLFERELKQSISRITTDLNDALKLAEIKGKKITFHCSRHTFAINSLILGIPLEVVSKILGHSDLKTTQIYAKVVDSLTNREMDKWNNISFRAKK